MMTPSAELSEFLDEEQYGEACVVIRAAQAQVSDGASTALKTCRLLRDFRLKVVRGTDAYQRADEKTRADLEEWIILQCQSHGVHNASLILFTALDAWEKDKVGDNCHATGSHHAVAGSAEVTGAEDGNMRCIYSFWKFIFDTEYYCGTFSDWKGWLAREHPELVSIVESSGRIVGGRFIATARMPMLLYPLWPAMTEFMEDYKYAHKSEVEMNRLAANVKTYLHQPFRLGAMRAAALCYCDFLGPLLFQIRYEQNPLQCRRWWQGVVAEIEALIADVPALKARLDAGLGLFPEAGWTFNSEDAGTEMEDDVLFQQFVSKEHSAAHAVAADTCRRGTASSNRTRTGMPEEEDPLCASTTKTLQPLQYCLQFLLEQLKHYGKRYLEGGDLHQSNLSPTVQALINKTDLVGLNDLVERLFALVDHDLTSTSSVKQTQHLQCGVMMRTNPSNQQWEDQMAAADPERWDQVLQNSKRKAGVLEAKVKKQRKAQQEAKDAAFLTNVAKYKTAGEVRVGKATDKILLFGQRCRTEAELNAKLAAVEEKRANSTVSKRDSVLVPAIEMYATLLGSMKVLDWDGKTEVNLKDVLSKTDGYPVCRTKTTEKTPKLREYTVLKENVCLLMKWTAGAKVSSEAVQQKAAKTLPTDSRVQEMAYNAVADSGAIKMHALLLKKRKDNASQEAGLRTITGGAAPRRAAVAVLKAELGQNRAEGIAKLKVAELKEHLEALGVESTGLKAELVDRLTGVLNLPL